MKYLVKVIYEITNENVIELPDDKTWEDVKHYSIKYDQLYIIFNDNTPWLAELNTKTYFMSDDLKWPDNKCIYPVEDDGKVDYTTQLQ
jgi:hypothetical protein